MARPTTDRMRLKDKIIDNISKAIKSIQELLYYQSSSPVLNGTCVGEIRLVLTNSDRQCHKLCENLDHALLHGLKQVTHGYWPVVKQLSHKGLVREIEILVNVTTDLGRGRAWLFAMLNEGLLESYIRLLGDNDKLIKKYYAKDALLLDGDRMNQLLTLTCGLEYVAFKFELDLPYLDLNAYPPRSRTDAQVEGDVFSTSPSYQVNRVGQYYRSASCRSMSEITPGSVESRSRLPSDSDSVSTTSSDHHTQADHQGLQMRLSTYSVDSGFPSDLCNSVTTLRQRSVTPTDVDVHPKVRSTTPSDTLSVASMSSMGEQDRPQRLENLKPATEEDENGNSETLEVIHITKKSGTGKAKRKKSASSRKDIVKKTPVNHPDHSMPETQSSGLTSHVADSSNKSEPQHSDNLKHSEGTVDSSKSSTIPDKAVHCSVPLEDSGVDIFNLAPDSSRSTVDEAVAEPEKDGDDKLTGQSKDSAPLSSMATIKSKIDSLCIGDKGDNSSQSSNPLRHSRDPDTSELHPKPESNSRLPNGLVPSLHSSLAEAPVLHPYISSSRGTKPAASHSDDENDFYSSYNSGKDNPDVPALHYQMDGLSRAKAAMQSSSQLKDYMDYILKSNQNASPSNTIADRDKPGDKEDDLSVSLDNNAKLQVMLDILSHEDEKFIKMFASRENMMEGDSGVVYLLISDQCLYFLKYKESSRKFIQHTSAMLTDLIFISTGINEQMISIESRNKGNQKQRLWVTPGHQALTKCILECLTEAVKRANEHITSVRSRFSVGSEVPLQKIALRKYISKELNCEPTDVSVNDYSLLFWEDPSSSLNQLDDVAHKEGTLLMWTQDPMKGYIWKPVYVVLKNSMLSVFNHKSDARPHSVLGLGGDQCIGCRLTSVGDRNNCVELVIACGGSWLFSAASEVEVAQWRHDLCLAVSKGMEIWGGLVDYSKPLFIAVDKLTPLDDSSLISCVPCCAVLSCGAVFLCHEDLQTKFFRTLGRAKVEDLTSLRVDESDPTYCILEFESQEVGVSSVHWVFYFSSAQDLKRYQAAIGQVWKETFQVEVPVLPVDNAGLQRSCRSHSQLLHQQLCLS